MLLSVQKGFETKIYSKAPGDPKVKTGNKCPLYKGAYLKKGVNQN